MKKWENEEPGVLAKSTNVLLKPLNWAFEKVIPHKLIEGAMSACNSAGSFLTDKGDILRDGGVSSISELRNKDLKLCDDMANVVHNWALGIAAAEGGAAGTGGAYTIALDIPALITLAYRTIHKIGLCYGYECNTFEDRMFANMVFQAASANTVEEKTYALLFLKQIEVVVTKQTFRKMAAKAAAAQIGPEALVIFLRNAAKSLGKNLTRRKALQVIPFVGAAVGAAMNASFIQDIAWAARRAFQKRWLIDNERIELE